MPNSKPEPQELIAALRAVLPNQATLITDPSMQTPFLRDQAVFAEFGMPLAVLLARDENEIVSTLKFASNHNIAVIVRGAGSGLSGGANAIDSCIVISLEKMDEILIIDTEDRYARVQAGVINAELDKSARTSGLAYLPDPASREWSTIGGNVATNAGGMCCVKYGVTKDHILGLRVVLANGDLIELGGITQKRVSTLDLTRLFVGSEGILGIITEVTVKLSKIPALPTTMVATFSDITTAAAAAQELINLGPSMLEIIDEKTLGLVETHFPMGLIAGESLLIFQDDNENSVVSLAEGIALAKGAKSAFSSTDPADSRDLIAARKYAFSACERSGATLLDDVVVPLSKIAQLVSAVTMIGETYSLNICVFGHAGDGNLHPTIVHDHGDIEAAARARLAFTAIVEAAQALGGTVSGEHGIGIIKNSFVHTELSKEFKEIQQGIKKLFDPQGILNPGRKL